MRRPERQDEAGAAAWAILDTDAAAVQFDNPFHEREPNADAAAATGIDAPKSGEYRLPMLFGNSGAPIFDDYGTSPRDRNVNG